MQPDYERCDMRERDRRLRGSRQKWCQLVAKKDDLGALHIRFAKPFPQAEGSDFRVVHRGLVRMFLVYILHMRKRARISICLLDCALLDSYLVRFRRENYRKFESVSGNGTHVCLSPLFLRLPY